MPVVCSDGVISDAELREWNVRPLRTHVQLARAEVCAVFTGPCLARGVALLHLSLKEMFYLFPSPNARKAARRLRCWAKRLHSVRVRAALAYATWHQLRAAAAHQDDESQIRAAVAHALKTLSKKPTTGRPASPED